MIKRLVPGAKAAAAAPKPKLNLSLPDEVNVPSDSLADYSVLIYGAKKIGKTSLCARFPNTFFMACEPGTKGLKVYTRPVRNWEEFIGYVELLEKDTKFSTVVVDTIDMAYEYAFSYICRKKMINHPHEEDDYGATWKEITETFRNGVLRLIGLSKGVIFTSHDVEKEIELRDGSKIDRVQPTMAKSAMGVVEALVDIIFNYAYDGSKRIIRLDGRQDLVAGNRVEEHFIRKGGDYTTPGDRVITVSMGKTAEEAYLNLMDAFNNKQDVTDVTLTSSPSGLVKKRPVK